MTNVALFGAGGKMGSRIAAKLVADGGYAVAAVETSETGRDRIRAATGLEAVTPEVAMAAAEVVVLAVPDRAIGAVMRGIIDLAQPGTAFIVLDAAAPHAGEMPDRADVTYFCTHPCHPPLWGFETDPLPGRDYFGGVRAPQGIVCALIQGPEAHYAVCEAIARVAFAPVARAHRCTLEQIAILEPALSETVGATFAMALREATEKAIGMGVDREAAVDFILGHLNIELAVAFEMFPGGRFSDGAYHAIAQANKQIFQEGWLDKVFNHEAITQSVREIVNPPVAPSR